MDRFEAFGGAVAAIFARRVARSLADSTHKSAVFFSLFFFSRLILREVEHDSVWFPNGESHGGFEKRGLSGSAHKVSLPSRVVPWKYLPWRYVVEVDQKICPVFFLTYLHIERSRCLVRHRGSFQYCLLHRLVCTLSERHFEWGRRTQISHPPRS